MDLDTERLSLAQQLDVVAKLRTEELLPTAHSYNWDYFPAEVLGAIIDRADCSLLTALSVFYLAEPQFYVRPERQTSAIYQMLKRIHDRVNSGGYRHDPQDHRRDWSFIPGGLMRGDNAAPCFGFWQLDPGIVLPALKVPTETIEERRAKHRAHVEKEAQQIAAGLRSNERVRRSTELLLPLMPDDIQARVAELMAAPARASGKGPMSFLASILKIGR
ncbi:DUF4274 domain-containing protein [Stagnihabitans tardus]|uniref:Uncharacterized protein n=1 Tax=Stagnihabitans tardus TaxID=2699202 RepID=A0AAE4YD70_9RHOB|nr:DUF4274 domain-containing protein [Stagnihabitans tardus]NBZ89291.1 hypothetical protein [Stagnihabitans tardus]